MLYCFKDMLPQNKKIFQKYLFINNTNRSFTIYLGYISVLTTSMQSMPLVPIDLVND